MTELRCPYCHQWITFDAGVHLGPVKAVIYRILQAADAGLPTSELIRLLAKRDGRRRSRDTVRTHIAQINTLLRGTDRLIVNEGKPPYRWHIEHDRR